MLNNGAECLFLFEEKFAMFSSAIFFGLSNIIFLGLRVGWKESAPLAFPFSHTDAHIDEHQGKHLRHAPEFPAHSVLLSVL